MNGFKKKALALLLALMMLILGGCGGEPEDYIQYIQFAADMGQEILEYYESMPSTETVEVDGYSLSLEDIPEYSGEPYVVVGDNVPFFYEDELSEESYEYYSDLDRLNRCGYAMASLSQDTMPTKKRESISHVKPSGWQIAKYDFVDGKYLYNRCHLIGFQLSAENDNWGNLITGTRYLNTEGMLPFENMVADYIKETGNHVLYRVTPMFEGDELVARGVQMEAFSVEDYGASICFNVYCYNVQPGVIIDYETGDNWFE